jgi:hypothetical protein
MISYEASSLEDIAAEFERLAEVLRAQTDNCDLPRSAKVHTLGKASGLDQAAAILRTTTIKSQE